MATLPTVAFVCVHNSCRSQIAEALGKKLAADTFTSYSAGTQLKDHINPDAVRLMQQIHQLDLPATQRPKLIDELPPIDIVITMGCDVECPTLNCRYREDWGLDDPTGQSDAVFADTIATIEAKIIALKTRLQNHELQF